MKTVVITGAAGLVGQNLVAHLITRPDFRVVGIDNHNANMSILRRLHPGIVAIEADLSQAGPWMEEFQGVDTVVLSHAQIGGLLREAFVANNVTATKNVLKACELHRVSYLVAISSSVVNSMAADLYSTTKLAQERMIDACAIPHVTLRPTLMFGWFDRKHLGWLRRFMDRTPFFPIPGEGKYIRQPLYAGDLVSIIASAINSRRTGKYDISGLEKIYYVDMIRVIHRVVKAKSRIVHIPYRLFWLLLRTYALVDRNPPFTTSQLEALVIPETFSVIDWPGIFDVTPTPFMRAVEETFLDPHYSHVTLEF